MRRWDLIEGDSLVELTKMERASADAVICDPPYCSGGMVRGDRASAPLSKYVNGECAHRYQEQDFTGDTRDQRSFTMWMALISAQIARVLAPGGFFGMFIDWRNLPALTDAVQSGGLVWRGVMVWDKGEGVRPQAGRPRNQAEYIVWGSNGPWRVWEGARVMPGVLRHSNVHSAHREHIAQKPIPLMRQLVQMCPPGGLVLDPFAGSGATMIAALMEGRRALGIELSPTWAAKARGAVALACDHTPKGGDMLPFSGDVSNA